jgi:hypothetical protein
MFTAAFGVTEQLVGPLAEESDLLRFILMEKPPTQKQGPVLRADRDLIISFGASLGEMYVFKNGQPVARKPIAEFELEKWLLRESHFRRAGHVFSRLPPPARAPRRSLRRRGSFVHILQWNAGCYETTQRELEALVPELRAKAAASGEHRRTPDIVANLAAGIGLFLAFAVDCGAVSEAERDELVGRSWRSLGEAARAQAAHQQPAEPARRFLELLRGAIASGRAHLAGVEGDRPEVHEESWGWRRDAYAAWEPKGERVGWLDGEHVYLEPDAAYAVVQRLGQEVGDRLPLTPQTLRRRLKEAGALASSETKRRMLTVRRTLEGQRREVLHLRKETLSPATEDAGPGEGGDACWSASVGGVVGAGSGSSTNGNGHLPGDSLRLGNLVGISTQETGSEEWNRSGGRG